MTGEAYTDPPTWVVGHDARLQQKKAALAQTKHWRVQNVRLRAKQAQAQVAIARRKLRSATVGAHLMHALRASGAHAGDYSSGATSLAEMADFRQVRVPRFC